MKPPFALHLIAQYPGSVSVAGTQIKSSTHLPPTAMHPAQHQHLTLHGEASLLHEHGSASLHRFPMKEEQPFG